MARTTVVNRNVNARIPMPVLRERGDGKTDGSCMSCPVEIGGMTSDQAESWAQRHKCSNWGFSQAGGIYTGVRNRVTD